jgi:mRNA-degrading endonuclease toxin of MazEF toxin-antitoxin module
VNPNPPASHGTLQIGDIVLVQYPFADGTKAKPRPALIVTSPDDYGDMLLMPITSQLNAHHILLLGPQDLTHGQLSRPSGLKVSKLAPVHTRLCTSPIARIRPEVLAQVRQHLCPHLGCN